MTMQKALPTALLLLANRWLFEHGVVMELQSERHVTIFVCIQLLESTSSQRAQTSDSIVQVGTIDILQRIERGQLVLASSCADKQKKEEKTKIKNKKKKHRWQSANSFARPSRSESPKQAGRQRVTRTRVSLSRTDQ